ncbi:MAG: H-NS histone family protein [Burkholderiales bacterium]|jgi:DNA-binding protein H-NS|nr:H-NS histone family protein [Burkholderiales bacterium]
MATYLELKAQAQKLLEQAEEMRKQEHAEAIAQVRAMIKEHGLTASDLGFAAGGAMRRRSGGKGSVPPKYRNVDGSTWSGRGRKPGWIQAAIDAGRSMDEFLI